MWVNRISRSGLLCVTLFLAIAKHKPSQSSFTKSCHSRESLSQAVDTLYVTADRLKAAIPIGYKGIYKAISELDILLSWIKELLENIS
ncbi:Interleukin-26 [Fukomys damarensis]|uniref:Interleukin-26 n=1 Tax=Fukomys damarensis TaxID=885580 RepID=A0A091D3K1_FUKDA|nr:Interleukin-26 [Fukomys damarensis]